MENVVKWHHRVPTDEEFALAMKDLEAAEEALHRDLGDVAEVSTWN